MKGKGVIASVLALWRRPVARIVTSAVVLVALLLILPLADLWSTVSKVSLGLWAAVVIAFIAGHAAGVVKWSLLINLKEKILPFSIAFRYYFAGLFANLYLPSIVGGDVVRAVMAIRFNKQKEAVILGSLLDRLLDTSALVIIILMGAFFSRSALTAGDRQVIVVMTLALFSLPLFGAMLLFIPLNILPQRLRGAGTRIRSLLRHLVKHPQRALAGLCLALLIQGGFVFLNSLLGTACGIDLPLAVWCLAWPLAKITAMVPVSLGGIGVREAALATLLSRFGIPFASSVGVGLLWTSILIVGGGFGGLFYLILRRDLSHVNSMGSAAPLQEKEI